MGMFNRVEHKIRCPKCRKTSLIDLQYKDEFDDHILSCDTYKVGDTLDIMDVTENSFLIDKRDIRTLSENSYVRFGIKVLNGFFVCPHCDHDAYYNIITEQGVIKKVAHSRHKVDFTYPVEKELDDERELIKIKRKYELLWEWYDRMKCISRIDNPKYWEAEDNARKVESEKVYKNELESWDVRKRRVGGLTGLSLLGAYFCNPIRRPLDYVGIGRKLVSVIETEEEFNIQAWKQLYRENHINELRMEFASVDAD